jgi:rod shape-determining protein MreC
MDKKRAQFILAAVLFLSTLYFLPFFGTILREAHVKIYSFFQNILMSQESGDLRNELMETKRIFASHEGLVAQLKSENEFLRERLQIEPDKKSSDLLLALVVGQGSGFGEETVIINKGSLDGLGGGEAVVLSPNILVGIVEEVFKDRAVVQLLLDSDFTLRAKTLNGAKGVLRGETGGRVVLEEVSQVEKFAVNEAVFTDSADDKIPPDVPIGNVEEILSKPTDIFQRATVKPLFDPSLLERVFIIVTK